MEAGAKLALLVAVIAWFHILFAISWVGSAVFFAAVLSPMLAALTPQARSEFLVKSLPKIERFELAVSTLTIVFGLFLALALKEWSPFIIFGATFGLTAYLIGLLVMTPLAKKMESILKILQNDPDDGLLKELVGVQKKFGMASMIELIMMLLTVSSMVAAGFL